MQPRLILFAHNIRSLWNVGSFFRTCDALGVEKLILAGYTGHPPRKEITKTAIGAEEWVPWEHYPDPLEAIQKLKDDGWTIIALELTDEAQSLESFVSPEKLCLVVGHELTGVPPEQLALCDGAVKIPMLGHKESLNVAVAAGIALYHARTARTGSRP